MQILSFGSNGSGQLGLGHQDDVSQPTHCLFDHDGSHPDTKLQRPPSDAGGVVRIAAGGNHTLILFESGAVYAAGFNADGRCGGFREDSLLRFRRVRLHDGDEGRTVDRFRDISASWAASFLIADNGKGRNGGEDGQLVYVLGSGDRGELGLGEGVAKASECDVLRDFPPRGQRIVSIASGMGHTVAVLSNGEVYGWGAARKGQLGASLAAKKIVWTPEKIEGAVPFAAHAVVCGREFTVITGPPESGQYVILGAQDDRWRIRSDAPSTLAKARLVAASWHGIYVHGSDSTVTAWGRQDRGQLPPPDLGPVVQIAVGSEHAIALRPDRKTVVAFGWGEHGNCGPEIDERGNVAGKYNIVPLPQETTILGLGAGCATSWIITS
ncbi:hypothetical protein VTN49DRAFT_4200 [Thermomyces lanuginosus]|uniref:uncharacterized protein n=1 Tax=Thermomyces lanuginosus TaxID=5541 RepID=UPI00374287E2